MLQDNYNFVKISIIMQKTVLLIFLLVTGLGSVCAQSLDDLSIRQLDSTGQSYYYDGDYKAALPYLLKSVEKARRLKVTDSVFANSLSCLGNLYQDIGESEKAEDLYLEVLDFEERTKGEKTVVYAENLSNLALLYDESGKPEEAEPLYLEATAIIKKILGPKHPYYAISLNNLAVLYEELERYAEAEPLYLQTLTIEKESIGDQNIDYASSLSNLAGLYKNMEKYAEAERLYLKAAKIWENTFGKKHLAYSGLLNNMALLYRSLERYEKAEEFYLEALSIKKENLGERHSSYTITLGNLAFLYLEMEKYEQSESLFLQALQTQKETIGEQHYVYFQNLNNLGILHSRQQNYDLAISYIQKSLQANTLTTDSISLDQLSLISDYSFANPYQALSSINVLIKMYKAKNDLVEQQEALQVAIKMNSKIGSEFYTEKDKLRALEETNDLVQLSLVNILALQKIENQQKNYIPVAFANAEQNKSILLAQSIKGNRARSLGDLPDSLVVREIALQENGKQLLKKIAEARTKTERLKLLEEQNNLTIEVGNFKQLLKNKFPKYHDLKYQNITASIQEIQKLLSNKQALIEYFVADSALYVFYVNQWEYQLKALPISRKQLNAQTKKLRSGLTNYQNILQNPDDAYDLYTETAHWFYQNIIAPVAPKQKSIRHLIFVPDGELGNLPFEVFLAQKAPKSGNYTDLDYLMKQYKVSYNYSATLLKETLLTTPKTNNQAVLAIAPHYNGDSLAGNRSLYLQQLRRALIPLPYAEQEAQNINNFVNGDCWTNSQASEAKFKAEAANYSVLHLAMHGLLNKQNPILSSLAFTENGDSLEDNFLQADEISKLDLNADLVVLSACETGYGKFEQGEGILSLARSFMYAGVPSLVVSLWSVNDASTATIMQHFYEYLAAGADKAEALRRAKIDYIQNAQGVTAHPAYWSPFIQIGNHQPVQLTAKDSPSRPWILGIGSLALLVGGLILRRRRKKASKESNT